MSSLFARARMLLPTLAGTVALGALAGCGAGQITQTDNQYPAVNGAGHEQGPLTLRNTQLAFPTGSQSYTKGADAPLITTIANSGGKDIKLISVRSPFFDSASIEGSKTIPAGAAISAGTDPDDQAAPPSSTASTLPEQVSPQDSSIPPESAKPAPKLPVGTVKIVLKGLKQEALRPGINTPVIFTFDTGSVTMQLPISAPYDVPQQNQ